MTIQNVSDYEFETVVSESGRKIELPNAGDSFVGTFDGANLVEPSENEDDHFTRLMFSDADGDVRYLNAGAKLLLAFESILTGSVIRLTYVGEIPMSDPGKNPMKDYRVEVGTPKDK